MFGLQGVCSSLELMCCFWQRVKSFGFPNYQNTTFTKSLPMFRFDLPDKIKFQYLLVKRCVKLNRLNSSTKQRSFLCTFSVRSAFGWNFGCCEKSLENGEKMQERMNRSTWINSPHLWMHYWCMHTLDKHTLCRMLV